MNTRRFSGRDWIWFVLCAGAVLSAIGGFKKSTSLESRIRDLAVFTITVQALDEQSGEPTDDITANIKPTVESGQIMKLWSSAAGRGKITQEFIGSPPFAGRI